MQNKQIKILFVDIDWTILDHTNNHTYDKDSLLALCEAQKRGVKVFYCTARPLYSLNAIFIKIFIYFCTQDIIPEIFKPQIY